MAETKKKTTKRTAKQKPVEVVESYQVQVDVPLLNVRKSHGFDAESVKVIEAGTVCEIVNEVDGWGEIAADAGWICLKFTKKI